MSRLLPLTALALGLAATLSAADGFTGFNAGVDLGYGRHEADWTDINYWWYGGTASHNTNGVLAGLHGGYDHQFGALVVGGILDWNYTSFDTTDGYSDSPTEIKLTNTMDWMATLRGRAGLAVDASLLYITYGLAMASVEHEWDRVDNPATNQDFKGSDEVMGTVFGVGVEHKLTERFSVRAELTEATFNDLSFHNENPGSDEFTFKVENHVTAFKIAGSYWF